MSITVSYFFNCPAELAELGSAISQTLGVLLEPYEGNADDLFATFMGLELSLGRHELENDGECGFEDYEFEISTRTATGNRMRAIQVEATAAIAYALHRRLDVHDGLLVFGVQIALAKYRPGPPRTNDSLPSLYDELSSRTVEFPRHLVDIAERIPNDGWK